MPVEIHRSIGDLADEWDELATRVAARPWFRPGWFECWWRAFGHGELCVISLRREDGLAAVLVLVRDGRALRSAANWHSPDFGMTAVDGDARRDLAAAALEVGAARVTLWLLDPDDGGLGELRAAAEMEALPTVERVQMRSPWVRVEGTYEDYLRERGPSAKRRKELNRCRRKLEERVGPVALEIHAEADDALLAEGFELEGSGWKREHGTAIASDPTLLSFYTDVARWAAAAGMLRLCFLRAGERRIAFELMLDDGRSLYDLKGGYDVACREYSPGLLLAGELIADAHERGLQTVELLGDAEPFKLTWTDATRDRVLFEAFARTPRGLAAFAAERYGRPAARRVLRR